MSVIVSTWFDVDATEIDEMLSRRNDLVSAVRRACPGLTDARLGRVDEHRWVDIWRWDSQQSLEAAVALVASGALPEREAAFALAKNPTNESATLVDER